MSLFQKYRPKDFNSLVWQEFVRVSLSNATKSWKTVWAYLFYWSRWTWKTSTARILAKAINCLKLSEDWNPCHECENCVSFDRWELLDVIEIDAASNTWVDNIRDLIEKAQFQPNQAKYKIYIIDEVHMLSKGAFNALLKTLEEPPEHVRFILATTELHKIPETIISRTQRYDFRKINPDDISKRLKYIATQEWIEVENEAVDLIVKLSRWWLRDAISFFEQYSIWGSLKLDFLKENLQLVWDEFLSRMVDNLISKTESWIFDDLEFLKGKWVDIRIFLEEILFFLRDRIISVITNGNPKEYIEIYEMFEAAYSKMKTVPNTFMMLEISIMKFMSSSKEWNISNVVTEYQKTSPIPKVAKKEIPIQKEIESKVSVPKTSNNEDEDFMKELENISQPSDVKATSADIIENNKSFNVAEYIESIRKDSWRWFVAMSLKASSFEVKGDKLLIMANNDFNRSKLVAPEVVSYLASKANDMFWLVWWVEILAWKASQARESATGTYDVF